MSTLSVIVITKNEEHNIRNCLSSIEWAQEIVVVDAGSTDKTVDIAKEFTRKVFVQPWSGYGESKNFGLAQSSSEWILWLDADERVTPELQKEIQEHMNTVPRDIVAFSMPRRANFLGHWIRHCGWYPGRVMRVFRKSSGSFTEDKVHERLVVNGRVKELNADLLHYTDPNLQHYLDKYNKYTSLAAGELFERKNTFNLLKLICNPVWVFLRMYIFRLGFLDGIPGLILCTLSANYVFTKYAKVWEYSQQMKEIK